MSLYLYRARFLLVCACLLALVAQFPAHRTKRDLDTRENVRRLQLQTMLKDLEQRDLARFQLQQRKLPLIILPRPVHAQPVAPAKGTPVGMAKSSNKNNNVMMKKRGTPCSRRRRRREAERVRVRRLTQGRVDGEGWVPAYQMYDRICEDDQPVEVVKIQNLVVRNGIIRDSMILEKAMLE